MKKEYDIIILGAGPAGLSLASELGKNISVLLIDSQEIGSTHKMWTSEESILKRTGYSRFTNIRFTKAYIQAYNCKRYNFHMNYCTLNEKKLLQYWQHKCKKRGVMMISHCAYEKYKVNSSNVSVKTTKGTFTAQYLIDCMGVNSPIVRQYKLWRHALYIPIIGEVIPYKSGSDEIVVAESLEPNRISFFELFPATKETSVIYSFLVTKKLMKFSTLRALHRYNKKHSPIAAKLSKVEPAREVYGTIPVGTFKEKSIERVMFFGDSLLLGTCALATGLSKILLHTKPFARHVRKVMDNKETLPPTYYQTCVENINASLQLFILMIVYYGGHGDMDALYKTLSQLSYKQRVNFTFALSSIDEDIDVFKKFIKHIPIKRIIKLFPLSLSAFLFQSIAKFLGKSLQLTINKTFNSRCPKGKLINYVACKKCVCLICKCHSN